jgi:hypothetical protein
MVKPPNTNSEIGTTRLAHGTSIHQGKASTERLRSGPPMGRPRAQRCSWKAHA